jgi:hypothetical protein
LPKNFLAAAAEGRKKLKISSRRRRERHRLTPLVQVNCMMEKALPLLDNPDKIGKLKSDYKTNKRSSKQDVNLFNRLNDETKNLEDCLIVWL